MSYNAEAQRRHRQKVKQLNIVFTQADQELIEHLSTKDNKQEYIKQLIKGDILIERAFAGATGVNNGRKHIKKENKI